MESWSISPKISQNVGTIALHGNDALQIAPERHTIFWLLLKEKLLQRTLKKCPIWSRWLLRVRPVLFTVPHVSRENNFSQETGLQGKPYLSYL